MTAGGIIPGQILLGEGDIEINPGREVRTLTVRNTGDRPVQVGSHFHFAEANAALEFDRDAAWGHRLAVPAGTSVRFEPGMPRDVDLVALRGNRIVPGLRGLAGGPLFPDAEIPQPTAAGPTTGPTTAGPTTAGPTTAGPTTAGPTTGPTTAGPTTGPTTAGPTTAGSNAAHPTAAGATALEPPAQPENGSSR